MTIVVGALSPTNELLERDDALADLRTWLEDAKAGRGRVVFVAGEAGVGKTALVRRFLEEGRDRARVLVGACDPLFTPRPLGPFVDVAQEVGGELHGLVVEGSIPYRIAEVLVQELSGPTPTILVLEDLHWADEATLDVVRLLARRIENANALLIASYREDELDARHPLRIVLGSLSSLPGAHRMRVLPLSQSAVATLADPYGADPDELYRLTSGNPFYVTEVLASDARSIPETVRDAVLARAASLSAFARGVLEAVSTTPSGAELWLVARLAQQAAGDLAECLSSGMLTASDGVITFRHELARLAIEESLNPEQRVLLHKRALTALQETPVGATDPARLAHHADGAGDAGAVLRFAREAGARASSLAAHREAAAQYRRALRYSDGLALAELAELLEQYSHECYLTDEAADAIGSLERAVECYRELGDHRREGATLCALAGILWCPGRGREARRVGLEAVTLLEQLPPGAELVRAYGTLSFLHDRNADFEACTHWGEKELALAQKLDVGEYAFLGAAIRDVMAGSARGLEEVVHTIELARSSGHHGLVSDALTGLVFATTYRSPYTRARSYIEEGVACASQHGLELARLYFLAFRARLELDEGRWADAAETAKLVLGERFVSTFPRTLGLVTLALVRARRGDPDAWLLLDEALDLSEPSGELPRIAPVAAARAEAAWLAGRTEAVASETDGAFQLALERRSPWAVGELATWRRRAGLEEDITEDAAEPFALELAGDPRGAADAWELLRCPYDAALALALSGEEAALRRALEITRGLGARPLATMVSRRLRGLGVRDVPRGPRPTTRENPAMLTTRELEVLTLLAEGLRNAEIGDRLVVSRRTVDHHVSAILRKLGARTRVEAIAAAARLGLSQHR